MQWERSLIPGSNQIFGVPVYVLLTVHLPLHPALAMPQPGLPMPGSNSVLTSSQRKVKSFLENQIFRLTVSQSAITPTSSSFLQMNVNSRSNITRGKQTSMGDWLDFFFFSQHCMSVYCDWISEDIHNSACILRNSFNGSDCDVVNSAPVRVPVCALSTNWTVVVKLPVT